MCIDRDLKSTRFHNMWIKIFLKLYNSKLFLDVSFACIDLHQANSAHMIQVDYSQGFLGGNDQMLYSVKLITVLFKTKSNALIVTICTFYTYAFDFLFKLTTMLLISPHSA